MGGRRLRTLCIQPTRRDGKIRRTRIVASRSSCQPDHACPVGPNPKCRAKQCRDVNCTAAKAESSYFARCYPDRVSAWRNVILPTISAVGGDGWITLKAVRSFGVPQPFGFKGAGFDFGFFLARIHKNRSPCPRSRSTLNSYHSL